MKHIIVLVVLFLSVVLECTGVEIKDEESALGESLLEVVQRLVKDVDSLKINNEKLNADNQRLKIENSKIINDNKLLVSQLTKLNAEITHLNNNGYAKFSVSDQQWQSLHMSAAAACRGSTPKGGHGPWFNAVYPRTTGHTCTQVCNATNYFTECDASLSIMGYMGRVKSANQPAGKFYNYQCESLAHPSMKHEEAARDSYIDSANDYLGYCCCRKP